MGACPGHYGNSDDVCLYIESYIGSEGAVHTCAAKSTHILEKEVSEMYSNLSFCTILIPIPG